jgi:quercetin dioxygenase-like cupin family protein
MSAEIIQSHTQENIRQIERVMRDMPQQEIPVQHTFGPGFYARTITIPAGTTLVGEEHATEHIFIVSKGDITLVSDGAPVRVSAGFQAVCRPGMKRAGYAHTETVCTNIHITEKTDLDILRAQLIVAQSLPAPEKFKEIAP